VFDPNTVRLIALDLDGTVLDDEKVLAPRTEAALRAVAAQGREVCFVTGRMLGSTTGYADQAGLRNPVVVLNGSLVTAKSADPIFCGAIPRTDLESSLELASPDVALYWFTRGELITEPSGSEKLAYMKTWNNGHDTLITPSLSQQLDQRVYQIHRVGQEAPLTRLAEHYAGNPALTCEMFQSRMGGMFHLEVRLAGIDKGAGLAHLARHLDVPIEQTLAMGDWLNDVPLMRAAGHGVAMGNAWPEVRAAANEVIEETNNEAGVAQYLERTFL